MKLYTTEGVLTPTAPFDFEKSLDFIGEFAPMAGEQTLAPRSVTKTLSLNASAVVFQLTDRGTLNAPALAFTLYSAHKLTSAAQTMVLERIRFFLSLDDDLRPFYVLGAQDPQFAPVMERWYGLHQVKFLSPFENAIWAVLTQRQPIRVAHQVKRALIEKYGSALNVNGTEFRAFPEVSQLASIPASVLNTLVRNERKTRYLCAVIEAFAGVDDHFLYHTPTPELRAWLLSIKGIGAWSADFILLRGLGRMENIRMPDYALRGDPFGKAVQKVYRNGKPVSAAEQERLAQSYGAYQGYWAYYLRVNA